MPVKMIYSKHDQTVPTNQVELIKNKLKVEPDITWLDNSDHVIVIDAERQIVRDETLKFCRKIFQK
jgi:esterase/lipase